jgi:hypothetical protein
MFNPLVPRLNSAATPSRLEHIATLPFLGDSPTRQTMRNIPLEPECVRNRCLPSQMKDRRFPQNPSGISVAFINSGLNGPENDATVGFDVAKSH